ncbi:23S rRNA (adenine(2030)-N(6))-methyltransferase RlmJ [Kinneretia asaccharophila]|jgi:23S rRNA (adenine2030-N6)-methyltransferase|uniref:Ribosomal RNA large subunit methyltransferase J n=1 Tax=Roseateles asaccharophilus TaxID=582607 RepID=A0A4V3CK72_9BURK|nr:23S rRNA (adenine(2030)-N(6))-methyltransferase RlmJ [Roseateles asaccharophilus]MDN3544797.1 23S rRNA (adenine(2030)-N(6))-methyltransferase RlmJ [Roseateles asaccharophilus]TDP12817.1 23S rRNA (adenine2030-N6)-methyltransferase [Roseateles asaccharophilus]
MLAYRHAFHAGNHADVLKHLVLAQVLRYMGEKDKAYTLVDTHAGAGGYSVESRYAQKNAEYGTGIAKLYDRKDLPAPLAAYVDLVRQFNPDGQLRQYPGSPAVAHLLMREHDRLRCYELHPTDHRILASYLESRPNTQVSDRDGFASLKGELPPPSRRAVVLMDPPYEIKTDYAKVLAALREGLQKFAEGVFLIWYPQLQLLESSQLAQRLKATADASAKKGWLHVRLTVAQADERGYGMLGSGMFIANPPYTLYDELQECLPYLVERLGQYDGANFVLEQKAV